MKRLWALLAIFASLHSFAQSPVIRARLEPANNIMVGQPVRLVVSVFVPNYFTGSPKFPEFEIDNAIVVLPQDRPENSNMQIGSNTYFGVTQTYVIYPQQEGDFHLPPAKLSVPYAIAPPKSITAEIALPGLSFHADVPPAARGLPYFLPTTRLTLTQHWSRPLKDLRTGDTVERTIVVTASKMQAMLIPPLELEEADGIRIYNGEPVVRDQKTDRGDFIYGQRIERAKYLIQKPGDYTLPPLELQWWDLANHRLATARLFAVSFSALKNPDYVAELPPPTEAVEIVSSPKPDFWRRYRAIRHYGGQLIAACFMLLVALWLIHRTWPQLVHWWHQRKVSETAIFHKLIRAVQAENGDEAYQNFLDWLRVVLPDMSLDEQLEVLSPPSLKGEIDLLTAYIYNSPELEAHRPPWHSQDLATLLKEARRHISNKRKGSPEFLFPLNPSSTADLR